MRWVMAVSEWLQNNEKILSDLPKVSFESDMVARCAGVRCCFAEALEMLRDKAKVCRGREQEWNTFLKT